MRLASVLLLLLLVPNASGQANMTLTVYVPYDTATGKPLKDEPAIVGAFAAVGPQATPTTLPEAIVTYRAPQATLPEAMVTYLASAGPTTSTTTAQEEPAIIGAQARPEAETGRKGLLSWITGFLKTLF